jgi:transcriptional antiterminator RfaH
MTVLGKSWSPIRSTPGVSSLVSFGGVPAKAPDIFIEHLRKQVNVINEAPTKIHQPGERLLITSGPFAGIEGIFELDDGESRAMLLIEILSKTTRINVPLAALSRVA